MREREEDSHSSRPVFSGGEGCGRHRQAGEREKTLAMASICSLLQTALPWAGLVAGDAGRKARCGARAAGGSCGGAGAAAGVEQRGATEEERRRLRRDMMIAAAGAAAMALCGVAMAEQVPRSKQSRNKCPTICVQNRTASCCFGN